MNCEICNKEFFVKDSYFKNRNRRFCGNKCRNIYFSSFKKTKNCIVCGAEFKDKAGGEKKYCSRECYYKTLKGKQTTNKEKIKKICPICKKEFYVLPSRNNRIYCSNKCFSLSRVGINRNVICAGWNKGLKWSKDVIEKFKKSKLNLYSDKENHPRWLGGKSFEPYSIDWDKKLKDSIRKRDGYKCKICGIGQKNLTGKTKKLSVHHIDYNKKNCSPDNLITLCNSCHVRTNTNRKYWSQFFQKI